MEDFWKDDFRPLQWAGKTILQALRDDEDAADADLYRRLTQSQEGSHLYFRSDSIASTFPAPPAAAGSNAYNINSQQQGNGGLISGGLGSSFAATLPPPTTAIANVTGTTPPPPIVSLKHRQSMPLPSLLTDALKQVQTCSFMGLLLPVDMAWMTVDSKLFLFSSENPAQGTIQCFENPRKQPILAVALVKPKQGIFKDVVEWCLVVTTPEEVILLALARYADSLKMIPTSFMMSTDLIRMQCAVGTDDGRIFLGGDDGCVHEMIYEDQTHAGYDNGFTYGSNGNDKKVEELLNEFYDGTAVLPDVVSSSSADVSGLWSIGKRTLQSVTSSGGGSPRKTRKLNRTTQASSIVTAMVPNVIRQASTAMFGGPTASQGGRIIRLVADPEREILYSLTEKGWISVMDITQPKAAPVVAVCDVPKTVRLYLEAVSRGQMFPPSNSSSLVGSIHFPGGGAAAQAGVGGMEGARNILKQADWQRNQQISDQAKRYNKSTTHPMITPVALHVIPCQDSSRLTLMAVTGGGLRLYFSALSSSILTTGGNVSLNTGSRMRMLGNKLSLCHIRSPPPLNMSQSAGIGSAAMWSADVAGGILPRVSGNSVSRVDASYYKDGQWIVAIEDPAEAVGSDILVAASPDTAFRPREGADGKRVTEPTGGLGESITFPIDASHENSKDGSFRVLHGGLVWEIGSDNKETSGTLDLLLHSPTPSNADLDAGLPPVFYPPSQIWHSKPEQKPPSSESRALVPYNPSIRTSVIQALANAVLNPFGVRSVNYGIIEQGQGQGQNYPQPAYRVSRRTGEQGFSMSAAERRLNTAVARTSAPSSKRAQTTKQAKAARLRQWLLQPPVKSLNQWTKQHVFSGKKLVTALNVHGVHKFEFDSILSSLADTIMAAGDNVGNDSRITNFFNGYGFKEGCAMCLALAIGCGPAKGVAGYNQQLSRRAVSAALARTYNPRLSREDMRVTSAASSFSSTNATDGCVPVGYMFFPSTLSEGLFSLVSRLTRPIWHKPLVVVTEGRSVTAPRWDLGTKLTSVKVEVLLCEKTLEQMQGPLQALMSLVRDVFSTAINAVPGVLGQQNQSMEIDGVEQNQFLTQSLQYHSQFRNSNRDSSSQLSPKECDNVARLLEERNIHSMYRLISRVVQLLNLLALLHKSEGIAGVPQVNWGLLHGVTVSQLVQSADGHDRLETLLNELVVATAESASSSPMVAQADFLASQLAQQCYLYFPPSSRFTYQGLRLAKQALSHPSGSSVRKEIGMKAAKQLMDASKHWQSAALISGRLARGNGKENYFQVASRAIQYSSPLACSVDLLIQLEDPKSRVSHVVSICLTTSQNFKALTTSGGPRDIVRYEGMLAWEGDLYHKNVGTRASDAQTTSNGPRQSLQSEVFGSAVTAEDAIETCYALIFYHLDGLLRSNRELADLMIQTACSAVEDGIFLTKLFSFLMESSNVDTLLRINSPEAESFLRSQSEPDLLWRHYSVLNKFTEAGRVAMDKATSDGLVGLDIRIEWLTKALSSYRSAQSADRQPTTSASNDPLSKLVVETEDLLRLASLQNRVLMRIDALPEFPETIDRAQYEEAKTCLLKASPLYNQFIAAAPFFDLGLVIFHMCRYDDFEATRVLWKSAFCAEILPCGTRNPTVFQSLQQFAADVGVADGVALLTDKMEGDGLAIFEDGDWVMPVKELVIRLGRELYGTGADYTFPIHFLIEQLEFLRSVQGSGVTPGWPLLTLAAAGVPYPRVLEAYETMPRNETGGNDPSKLLVRISGSFELLKSWVSESRSAGQAAGQHSTARADLSRSMSTGDLMPRLNSLRSILEQMQGPGVALLEQLNSIEDHISYLVTM